MVDEEDIYDQIFRIRKRLDRLNTMHATKVVVGEKCEVWSPFASIRSIFQILVQFAFNVIETGSVVTKATTQYCLIILLILGHGVAIGGGYNAIIYEDKVVALNPRVESAQPGNPRAAEEGTSVADVSQNKAARGGRIRSPAALNAVIKYCNSSATCGSEQDATDGVSYAINAEDKVVALNPRVESAQPGNPRAAEEGTSVADASGFADAPVSNKIKLITPDGVVRTLYCNPGPCTPGSIKKHENISGVPMGVPIAQLGKALVNKLADKGGVTIEELDMNAVFEQAEALVEAQAIATNDKNWASAKSMPLSQVERAKVRHDKSAANNDDDSAEQPVVQAKQPVVPVENAVAPEDCSGPDAEC
jgi:hypothetical protein